MRTLPSSAGGGLSSGCKKRTVNRKRPICTLSPGRKGDALWGGSRCPFSSVPFVEPRSSTSQPSRPQVSRACWPETWRPSRTTSLLWLRPNWKARLRRGSSSRPPATWTCRIPNTETSLIYKESPIPDTSTQHQKRDPGAPRPNARRRPQRATPGRRGSDRGRSAASPASL